MYISHKGHNNIMQVYSVTVMTYVKALEAGQSSQGTSEPITPARRSRLYLADRASTANTTLSKYRLPERRYQKHADVTEIKSNQVQRKEIIIWRPPGSSFDSGGLEISSDGLETKCNVKKYSFGDRRARALTAAVSKSVATV